MSERDIQQRADMFQEQYDCLCAWIDNLHANKRISSYLKENGYQSVAIYGNGKIGKRLIEELEENTDVTILRVFDRNGIVYGDTKGKVDAVIVTPIYHYEEIRSELVNSYTCSILSLSDIIYAI